MIKKELQYLLEKYNMTYQELAEKADVPLETMRNLYYGRVNNPKISTLLSISRVLRVSVNRLMGERLYTQEEENLIMDYRQCGSHGKSIIEFTANYARRLTKSERESINKFTIPCIIPLGSFCDGLNYDNTIREEVLTDNKDAYIAMEIGSNIFVPTYCKSDKILISDRFPEHKEIGVFVINNKIYVRMLIENEKSYVLKTINGRGEDFRIHRPDEILCMGTCVGVIRS